MWYTDYGNPLLFILGAFGGTGIIFFVSMFISKYMKHTKTVLEYFGQNTLPIIEFHYPLGYMLIETFFYKVLHLQYMANSLSGNLEGFIYAVLVIVLLIPVTEIINRLFPWMVGKKRRSI